jgi:hypothetical protein
VRSRLMLLLCAALLFGSCKLATPANNTKESFSGTLQPAGKSDFYFTVKKSGEYQMKITSLDPVVQPLGLAFGVPVQVGCSYLDANSNAYLNFQALGNAITPGSYCGTIYDIGTMTVAVNFTVEVSHP